jgi:hypothetical protein
MPVPFELIPPLLEATAAVMSIAESWISLRNRQREVITPQQRYAILAQGREAGARAAADRALIEIVSASIDVGVIYDNLRRTIDKSLDDINHYIDPSNGMPETDADKAVASAQRIICKRLEWWDQMSNGPLPPPYDDLWRRFGCDSRFRLRLRNPI